MFKYTTYLTMFCQNVLKAIQQKLTYYLHLIKINIYSTLIRPPLNVLELNVYIRHIKSKFKMRNYMHCFHFLIKIWDSRPRPIRLGAWVTLETRYSSGVTPNSVDLCSRSNHMGTSRGSQRILGTLGPCSLGMRAWLTSRNMLLHRVCYHTKFGCPMSNHSGVGRGPKNFGDAGTLPLE